MFEVPDGHRMCIIQDEAGLLVTCTLLSGSEKIVCEALPLLSHFRFIMQQTSVLKDQTISLSFFPVVACIIHLIFLNELSLSIRFCC